MILLIQPLGNKYDFLSIRVPNGLLHVAAPLVREGYCVVIVDQKTDYKWKEKVSECLDKGVTCVGITCSTGSMINHAIEISMFIKEKSRQVPVVWGGPHPSLLPEQSLNSCRYIDIVVVNEGDKTFFELVKALEGKKDLKDVEGIYYKSSRNHGIISTAPGKLIEDLDDLAPLPYNLIDIEKYSSIQSANINTKSIDLVSSRGCPFNCAFCSVPSIPGGLWRAKSVERMLSEIEFLKENYRIVEFYFVDDNFMVDLFRVERFADELLNRNLNILWGLQGVRVESVMKMPASLLDKLELSGLTELSIGVESGNPRILKIIDKRIKLNEVMEINRKLKDRTFQIKYNFIVGFPTETFDEIKKSVELALQLAKENRKVWFPFNIYTPFPGTRLFDFAIKNGFEPPTTLLEWAELESSGVKSRFRKYISQDLYNFLCNINSAAYLAFPIAKTKITNKFYRFLFSLYVPFAYFRFSRHFYRLYIEKYIINFLLTVKFKILYIANRQGSKSKVSGCL